MGSIFCFIVNEEPQLLWCLKGDPRPKYRFRTIGIEGGKISLKPSSFALLVRWGADVGLALHACGGQTDTWMGIALLRRSSTKVHWLLYFVSPLCALRPDTSTSARGIFRTGFSFPLLSLFIRPNVLSAPRRTTGRWNRVLLCYGSSTLTQAIDRWQLSHSVSVLQLRLLELEQQQQQRELYYADFHIFHVHILWLPQSLQWIVQ